MIHGSEVHANFCERQLLVDKLTGGCGRYILVGYINIIFNYNVLWAQVKR